MTRTCFHKPSSATSDQVGKKRCLLVTIVITSHISFRENKDKKRDKKESKAVDSD
jgi:hypothetical protein